MAERLGPLKPVRGRVELTWKGGGREKGSVYIPELNFRKHYGNGAPFRKPLLHNFSFESLRLHSFFLIF